MNTEVIDKAENTAPGGQRPGPVMLFCVGAQKAGTTSLHKHLKRHPDCKFRYPKEIGFFSRNPKAKNGLRYFDTQIDRLGRQIDGADKAPWQEAAQAEFRRARHIVKNGNADAFRKFLFKGVKPGQVVADFSPGYAMKDRDTFARMRDFHEDVRLIFVLRDPVERAWSNARHIARAQRGQSESAKVAAKAEVWLRKALDEGSAGFDRRCDYARTVTEMRAVLPDDKIGLFVFEEIFSGQAGAMDPVYDFLGISRLPDGPDVRNKGIDASLPGDLRAALRDRLAPQYDGVTQFLGRRPEGWAA